MFGGSFRVSGGAFRVTEQRIIPKAQRMQSSDGLDESVLGRGRAPYLE